MNIVYETPPEQKAPWVERLEGLLNTPGEWARVYEAASVEAAQVAALRARRKEFVMPDGEFEFKAGAYEERGAVWARFIASTEVPTLEPDQKEVPA